MRTPRSDASQALANSFAASYGLGCEKGIQALLRVRLLYRETNFGGIVRFSIEDEFASTVSIGEKPIWNLIKHFASLNVSRCKQLAEIRSFVHVTNEIYVFQYT